MAYAGEDADQVQANLEAERARRAAWWASLTPEQQEAEKAKWRAEAEEWARLHPPDDGGWLSKVLDWAPAIMAVAAVIATAGAAASALGAAGTAGATAAGTAGAAGATAGAAGATAAGAAAGSVLGAEVLAGIPAVFISAPALPAAVGLTAGQIAAIGAGAIGAGAIATGMGGAGTAAPTATTTATPTSSTPPPNNTIDPNIPTVNVSAPKIPAMDYSSVGLPVAGSLGAGAMLYPDVPNTVHVSAPAPTPEPGVQYPADQLPLIPIPPIAPIGPIDLPLGGTHPSGAGAGGTKFPVGLIDNLVGGLLPGAVMGGLFDDLWGGDKPAADGSVGSAIGRLNSQGDAQMAEWNNWLFPKAKEALDMSKNATNNFVNNSSRVGDQLETYGQRMSDVSEGYLKRHNEVYVPAADRIINDAKQFDKAGYQQQQAGLAIGDMSAAYAAAREAQRQRNSQYGIDPTSGRAMAFERASDIDAAGNMASAAVRARMAAEDVWDKKQLNALGTSRFLNEGMTTYGSLKTGAGNLMSQANNARKAGVDATNNYFNNTTDLAKTSSAVYGTANNAYNAAGQLGLGKSKLDNDRYIAEQQGRGAVLGAGLSAIGGPKGIASGIGDLVDAGKSLWDLFSGG